MKTLAELAREAGFNSAEILELHDGPLERFAAAVRAQVLEEAARVCLAQYPHLGVHPYFRGGAEVCAAAIRALVQQPKA